jgi:DNA-binding NarL/FixJ family response regulator
MSHVRVGLVDDHAMFREGLGGALSREEGIQVVFEASDARSLLRRLDQPIVDFDVLLVDISLPGSDGISLVRELRRRGQTQPCILLSMHTDLDMILEGLAVGARGYVFKSQSTRELADAIRTVLAGERYLPSSVDGSRVEKSLHLLRSRGADSPIGALSPREREVFALLIRGYSNTAVAAELFISPKTAETHRAHIFEKLGTHSVTELVRLAARHNLLMTRESPDPRVLSAN